MTISTSSSSIQVSGNGSTFTYNYPFVADAASDISVSSIASNGVPTLLSSSQYTLTINPASTNQLWGVGGTVTYPLTGIPLTSGQSLLIQRILPYTQTTSVQNQGNYYAQVTEQALDTLEMQIQQLAARTTQFRGTWKTGVSYAFGDIVQDGANGNNTLNYYICTNANTSGVWGTDLAAGYWAISVVATVPANIGFITLTGDVTASGTSPLATTLATVNSNIGTFANPSSVTVNGKGLITAIAAGSAAATPAMTLLATQVSAGTVGSISDTTHVTGAYSHYIWEISNLTGTSNGVDALVTVQQGGSFVGGTSYIYGGILTSAGGTNSGHGSTGASSFTATLGAAGITATSTQPSTVRFEFWNPATSAQLICRFDSAFTGTNSVYGSGGGNVATTATTTGVKIAPSAGAWATYTANLYGVT